jgi:ABC-type Fe3+-hydroxamate transport system substrate-binding protein
VIVDAIGQRHAPARGEVRIVSLVPSLTELLCELGLAAQVVGRTGFCVHPRDTVRAIPKVGGTKDVDLDKVRALAPTHLVVNVDENEKPVVDALRASVPNVIVTHPIEVADNLALYELFGRLFHRQPRAAALQASLRRELEDLAARPFAPMRVLYLIWRRPWMTVGPDTYVARMLATVGLQAVAPPSDRRYPELSFGSFGPERFDAVLLSTEPYRFTEAHVRELEADPLLGGRAVQLIDGEMTSWYGSRAIDGLGYLRRFRQALESRCAGRREPELRG